MRILHLTFNYPDELTPRTTYAIKRLIDVAQSFSDNHCISLHNGRWWRGSVVRPRADHTLVELGGMPHYIGLTAFLERALRALSGCSAALRGTDLIHGHKLTMEGVLAYHLSEQLGVPYCISIRATDLRLLRWKPALKPLFFEVLRRAKGVAVVSPWMIGHLREAFQGRWNHELEEKLSVLGNVVDGELRWRERHNGRYVMPFAINKSQLRRKNVFRTLQAIADLRHSGQPIALDLLGDGSGRDRVARAVRQLGLRDQVHLRGRVPHGAMIDVLSGYKALLLCSYPETFGLVYVEALIAGIPLVYAKDTGVDGWFESFDVGTSACASSVTDIAEAIGRMETRYADHKSEVRRLQDSGGLEIFGGSRFAERLRDGLYRL